VTYEEVEFKRNQALGELAVPADGVRRMNLLILGAGGQSFVVKEVAESLGVFGKIAFLDDDLSKPHVLGKPTDCVRFLGEYPIAIPSVGNNELRKKWIEMLAKAGFIIPTLISPAATVSPSATIEYGTLIEPKVIVGANSHIGHGCILSSGAIIERDAVMNDYVHIDYGVTVRKI
jgi:acetyltransferase-like isoleucine patch superfamily enzyme